MIIKVDALILICNKCNKEFCTKNGNVHLFLNVDNELTRKIKKTGWTKSIEYDTHYCPDCAKLLC